MTTPKSFPVACLAAAAFALIYFPADFLRAQSPLNPRWDESGVRLPAPVEPSTPELVPPGAVAGLRPIATFTFGNGQKIKARSTTRRFRLVGLYPGEIVDIALQFPAGLANSATAQSLDGGKLISFSKSPLGVNGVASIRFQAGTEPGLYRVFVPGTSPPVLLQFWVADPNNPRANPPVVNPAHRGVSR